MEQWEHWGLVTDADPEQTVRGAGITLTEYLNRLGAQGWQLVSVTPSARRNEQLYVYWLKRRKPDTPPDAR